MKRSDVNKAILRAKDLLDEFKWSLPVWAEWSTDQYLQNAETAQNLYLRQMGWDVTDFGRGDFAKFGLTLFCVRNGVQSDQKSLPYAEKLLFVEPGQETPFHCHKVKLEDIINRGGGNLFLEFCNLEQDKDTEFFIETDGITRTIKAFETLVLTPGESVTIPRGIYHRFYGDPDGRNVLVGEVSQVNDDGGDNYFLEEIGRFSDIEENETAIHPLWNEVGNA